ncbi:MAG: hypothetical protein JWR16_2481 [Nevskia sp.]|nr:hypothetical protein [Nevskia sp.]
MQGFIGELKRRNVLRVAAFYAGAGWLLVQIATQVFPFFDISNGAVRSVVLVVLCGFPCALALAWVYELTPEGIKRDRDVDHSAPAAVRAGRKLDRWIIVVLALAVLLLLARTFMSSRDAPAAIAGKSIAVLPLVNESGDPANEYFSDGLSEELISVLGQLHPLRVIGRASSFQFKDSREDPKDIGQKLNVATLLEGSVRRDANRVRIVAELVNAADGTQLWSRIYDRELQDIFAVQSEIAQDVAATLKITLLGSEGRSAARPSNQSLDAYNALLQGNFYVDRSGENELHRAIAFYQDALRLDANYALAHARLALAWEQLARQDLGGADAYAAFAKARAEATQALSLDASLAEAHVALGYVHLSGDFDLASAETEFRRAMELAPETSAPKNALAVIVADRGHIDEALSLVRQSLALDPLGARGFFRLAEFQIALRHFDEAEQSLRRAMELQPRGSQNHALLAVIEIELGRIDAAAADADSEPDEFWRAHATALTRQLLGDPQKADAALNALIERFAIVGPFQIATVYALRKDTDKMFEWLDRAYAIRDPGVNGLLWAPFLNNYRKDPRFAAFCRKAGLPLPPID